LNHLIDKVILSKNKNLNYIKVKLKTDIYIYIYMGIFIQCEIDNLTYISN